MTPARPELHDMLTSAGWNARDISGTILYELPGNTPWLCVGARRRCEMTIPIPTEGRTSRVTFSIGTPDTVIFCAAEAARALYPDGADQ